MAERLDALLPGEATRQLVALLEEYQRRAASGKRVPRESKATLHLDERTGRVVELELPRLYGW